MAVVIAATAAGAAAKAGASPALIPPPAGDLVWSTETIPLPTGTVADFVALDQTTGRAYVTEHTASGVGALSVIDTATNTVVTNLDLGPDPRGVAVDPTRNLVYVADHAENTLWVIDGARDQVRNVIQLPAGTAGALGVAANPATDIVYVSEQATGQMAVIDDASAATGYTVRAPVPIPAGDPTFLSADPRTNRIYVPGFYGTDVIDGTTNKVVDAWGNGAVRFDSVVDPASQTLYVSDSLGLVEGWSLNHPGEGEPDLSNHDSTAYPDQIAVDAATNRVYVTYADSDTTVAIYDGTTGAIEAQVSAGPEALGIAYDTINGAAYVADEGANTVTVIEPPRLIKPTPCQPPNCV